MLSGYFWQEIASSLLLLAMTAKIRNLSLRAIAKQSRPNFGFGNTETS
jgi:hypothetical protein